jgi:hypothetical protein
MVQGFHRQDILWSKDFIDRTSYGPRILDRTYHAKGFYRGHLMFQGFHRQDII